MIRYAIIVAGGKGLRMGTEVPKQFLPIAGKPVLMHTISRFHAYDDALKSHPCPSKRATGVLESAL